jgi:hypothetical protein
MLELMKSQEKSVRQSVTLPSKTAAQVRNLAKTRKLSSNRMLVELIENGIEAEKRKQQEFFELAERFRNATDPEEVCLGPYGLWRLMPRMACWSDQPPRLSIRTCLRSGVAGCPLASSAPHAA